MAEYLFTVSDKKLRSTLYQIQTQRTQADDRDGQTRQNMAAPEQRLCSHCDLNQMETELHFLTECSKYTDYKQCTTTKYSRSIPHLQLFQTRRKLAYLLGEHKDLLCACCSIWSLSPQKRRHSPVCVSVCVERDLLCVCCSICVSLSPQKRRHSVCLS